MPSETRVSRSIMCALPGPDIDTSTERALSDLSPMGVCLFGRNLKGPAQVRDLISGIREICAEPVLISVDQEGGRVNRLAGFEPIFERLPDGRSQARWSADQLGEVWRSVGHCLAALGFDVDFAPVVDLDDGPGLNAIGPRSYGTDPRAVSTAAKSVLEGLAEAGIAGCLKHFPGLGGTHLDTHQAPACSRQSLARLREEHTEPFRRLAATAPLIMTAHAHYPAVDGETPGSFSEILLRGWLREEIGYDGLIISDDLEMKAVAKERSPGRSALDTLRAGADLALFCGDLDAPRRARDDLSAAVDSGDLDPAVLHAGQRRLAKVLVAYPGGRENADRPGNEAREAYERALRSLATLLDPIE